MSFLFGLLARRSQKLGLDDGLQTLEAAYRKQIAALEEARRGVADVLAAEKRLELEAQRLAADRERFRIRAAEAKAHGDEPIAKAAHENESFVAYQRDRLLEQIADVRHSRVALESMMESVRLRVELFRTEKMAAGARYVVARAASRSGTSLHGVANEMREVARLTEAAREKSQSVLDDLPITPPAVT